MRVYPDKIGFEGFKPGDYGRDIDGVWRACSPHGGVVGDLHDDYVFEHSDGTITVSRRIRFHDPWEIYDCYLKEGIWGLP